MPRPNDLRARILHLYSLYTVLDADLVARALSVPPRLVNGELLALVRTGRIVRAPRHSPRRPYTRTEYQRGVG